MTKIILFLSMCFLVVASSLYLPLEPYPENSMHSNPNKQCPNINCTIKQTEKLKPCKNDYDCLQKETCCNYPCEEGKTYCVPDEEYQYSNAIRAYECAVIKNCKKWKETNGDTKECNENGDCLRVEKCCYSPCFGKRVCQKPVEVFRVSPRMHQ